MTLYSSLFFFPISQAVEVTVPSSPSSFLCYLTHNMTKDFTLARPHGFIGSSVFSYAHNSVQHWLDSLITWQTSFSLIMTLIPSSHNNKLIAAICLLKYFGQKIIFCSWHNCPFNSVMYIIFLVSKENLVVFKYHYL